MGSSIGNTALTLRDVTACMAMVTLRTEKEWSSIMGFSHEFVDLKLSRNDSLDTVINKISRLPFGVTDCSLPMKYAIDRKLSIDAFIVYSDGDTWAGEIHADQMLKKYRKKTGKQSKFICCTTIASKSQISDPEDPNSLDIVGFDSATPAIIGDFVRGSL